MAILALKQVEINTKRCIKNQLEKPLEILCKTVQGSLILQAPKICLLEANSAALAADGQLPGRPPTVDFLTLRRSVDRPVDRQLGNGLAVDRPVDRAISKEQKLSGGRSCGRSVQPVHVCAYRSTEAVDRLLVRSIVQSTDRGSVQANMGIKNLAF